MLDEQQRIEMARAIVGSSVDNHLIPDRVRVLRILGGEWEREPGTGDRVLGVCGPDSTLGGTREVSRVSNWFCSHSTTVIAAVVTVQWVFVAGTVSKLLGWW